MRLNKHVKDVLLLIIAGICLFVLCGYMLREKLWFSAFASWCMGAVSFWLACEDIHWRARQDAFTDVQNGYILKSKEEK